MMRVRALCLLMTTKKGKLTAVMKVKTMATMDSHTTGQACTYCHSSVPCMMSTGLASRGTTTAIGSTRTMA